MTVDQCLVFNDVPFGLAQIHYTNPDNKWLSFNGIGVFNEGKLHNAPFVCSNGNGRAYSFSLMIDGRPSENNFCTHFYEIGF